MPVRQETSIPEITSNRLVTKTLKERAKLAHKKAKAADREQRSAELLPALHSSVIGLLNAAREADPPKFTIGKPESAKYKISVPLDGQESPLNVSVYGRTFESDTSDNGTVLNIRGFSLSIEASNAKLYQDFGRLMVIDMSGTDQRYTSRPAKPFEVRSCSDLAVKLTQSIVDGSATVENISN